MASYTVGGVDLSKYAYNISTRTGMLTPPSLRGESRTIPFKPGAQRMPRISGERLLTMDMWVIGADPDTGDVPDDPGALAQFEENLDFLQRTFYRPAEYLPIVRTRQMAAGPEVTTGTCQYVGGLDPEMTGNTRAQFVVELLMSDPWFYGADVSVNVPKGTTQTLTNPGSVDTLKVEMVLNGPLTNPVVTNTTLGISMTYGGVVASGETVTVDVWEWDAEKDPGNTKVWGLLSHANDRHWMRVRPGGNQIQLTADSGTGSLDITATPAYL